MIVDIAPRFEHLFPIGEPPFVLELHAGGGEYLRFEEPTAVAVFRILLWRRNPDTGAFEICDVREQEIGMGRPELYEDAERVEAFFTALANLLAELVELAEPERLGQFLPSDLICPDALALRKPCEVADFERALRAKKRLGRWLRED